MAVDQLLRKNFWLVVLPLVATAAWLNAQAVSQLVGVGLAPDEKALSAPPPVAKTTPTPSAGGRNVSAEPILARNPFDHVTGSLKPPVVSDDGPAQEVPANTDIWAAPACDGIKVIVVSASDYPDALHASTAVLTGGGETKPVIKRRGDEFAGKQVEFIGWDRVWFASGATRCQAQLLKPVEAAAGKPAATVTAESEPPPPTPKRGAPALDPSLAKGIQKVSSTEFNIDRGVVDKILENQAELMKQARIVPEQENGKTVGIRLYGIRPDTLLGTLGMVQGDRLEKINGFDMASPEKALEAYARLRTADKLAVQLTRNGKIMNLEYNIK